MLAIIELVLPILIVVLAGYLAARFRILGRETGNILCQYLFYFAIPFLTFSNIYNTGLAELLNFRFMLTAILTIFIVIATSCLVFRYLFHFDGQDLIMMVFGSFYINIAYMGIPITSMVLGSVIPLLIILVIQASILFPIIVFLMDLKSGTKTKYSFKDMVLILVKNPILMASLIAIASLLLKIEYPKFILETTELMGRPASTTGLFALGFTCFLPADRKITKSEIKNALTATFLKLIFMPSVAWIVGKYVFQLDRWWLIAIVICAMLPTAINHFIVSQRYLCRENESKMIILFSTFGFAFGMSLFLYLIGGI